MKKGATVIMLIGALFYIAMLATDTEVLLDEAIVKNAGDTQETLVCKYFNGRKVLTETYWYAPNDLFGRSSCSFIN